MRRRGGVRAYLPTDVARLALAQTLRLCTGTAVSARSARICSQVLFVLGMKDLKQKPCATFFGFLNCDFPTYTLLPLSNICTLKTMTLCFHFFQVVRLEEKLLKTQLNI